MNAVDLFAGLGGWTAGATAAIQGFPDSYRVPEQRTLAGKLLGNAVPPPMARAIVEQVIGRVA